jgi:glycosidase
VKAALFLLSVWLVGIQCSLGWAANSRNSKCKPKYASTDGVVNKVLQLPRMIASDQGSEWWKSTSIYQIYPRSFQDSNRDGIGDLQGIISRLDYVQQLGFETIWVSPFYAGPQKDFGYDISDYLTIAPEYGTMADAEELIVEVHRRGMKIVFDMVLNHTSDQHAWFLESRSSRTNPKADWYIWRDGKGKDGQKPPTNWASLTGPNGWQYPFSRI